MSLQFFNPWIGRMNRQQFLLGAAVCGAAIYLGTSLIKQPALVVALNVFFGFMLFVFVMRRLSDQHSDDHSQKSKRFTLAKQWFEDMAPVLLYPLKAYARLSRRLRCYPYISYIFSFFVFLFLWVLAAIYKTFAFAITLVQMTLIASLLFCIFYVLMRAGNTEPNHYGRPPEGMNFWTTVPATYPDKRKAAVEKLDKLKERHQQRTSIADSKNIPSEEKKVSLQFFNPWIGRMNRQQFLLGAALCGGIMFSGFHLIQEPALVVILNFICCYTIFVFVLRRLADQRPNPDVSVSYEYLSAEEAYESARANRILLARAATNFRQAGHLMVLFVPMNPVVLGVLFIVVVVPLMVIVEFLAIPILITLGALVLFIMLGDGLPYANQYGHPPLGMNFKTTIPATYPDALIERFDKVMQEKKKEERDFDAELIELKTKRKAKTGGVTPYVEFRGESVMLWIFDIRVGRYNRIEFLIAYFVFYFFIFVPLFILLMPVIIHIPHEIAQFLYMPMAVLASLYFGLLIEVRRLRDLGTHPFPAVIGLREDALYKEIYESVSPGTMVLPEEERQNYLNEVEVQKLIEARK